MADMSQRMKGKVKMMKSMNFWWGIFMTTYWRRGQVFLLCKTVINKWKWKSLHENEDEDIQQKKQKKKEEDEDEDRVNVPYLLLSKVDNDIFIK